MFSVFYLKNREKIAVIPCFCLLLILLGVSCKQPKPDAALMQSVNTILASDPAYKFVNATVSEGNLLLSGRVQENLAKTALLTKIDSIDGIVSVSDQIVLSVGFEKLTEKVFDLLRSFPTISCQVIGDQDVIVTGHIAATKWNVVKKKIELLGPRTINDKNLKTE